MIRPAFLALLAAALAGCDGANEALVRCNENLIRANKQLRQLREENRDLRDENRQLRQANQALQAVEGRQAELLPSTRRIRLGRYTGGADTDLDSPGHETIRVYLEPIDQHGDVIKAVGEVHVKVFDLAAEEGQRLVLEKTFPAEQLHEHWSEGFGGRHYVFDLPLGETPPAHRSLTLRTTFLDFLTGKTFEAQKPFEIKLPQ